MEDWEQFFDEKSRRRSGKERRQRLKRFFEIVIGGAIVGMTIIAGIVGFDALYSD